MRICSFVPGATELLAELALGSSLVGRSHECDYPPEIHHVPILTASTLPSSAMTSGEIDASVRETLAEGRPLYRIDSDRLRAADPDLVITQGLCDVCGITSALVEPIFSDQPRPPHIASLNPSSLEEMLADTLRLGELTGTTPRARARVQHWRTRLDAMSEDNGRITTRPRVVCLEWLDPLYVAGHWVPDMVRQAGGIDVLGRPGAPSYRISGHTLMDARPDILVLMPCGFSLARTIDEFGRAAETRPWTTIAAVQEGRVFVVDGHAHYSRPGPRLLRGLELLARICADPDGIRPQSEELVRLNPIRPGATN